MPSINYKVDIDAPPEKVFDLICRVEEFKDYSRLLRDVKKVSTDRYLWHAEYLGVSFEWETEVTESERPTRFAWESRSGIYNTGSYTLEPTERGTCITVKMEFRIPGRLRDIFTAPILSLLMSKVNKELLENVKRTLDVASAELRKH